MIICYIFFTLNKSVFKCKSLLHTSVALFFHFRINVFEVVNVDEIHIYIYPIEPTTGHMLDTYRETFSTRLHKYYLYLIITN